MADGAVVDDLERTNVRLEDRLAHDALDAGTNGLFVVGGGAGHHIEALGGEERLGEVNRGHVAVEIHDVPIVIR